MANAKISELADATLTGTEQVPINQSGTTKSCTTAEIAALNTADMTLAGTQSVTGAKTFNSSALKIKGSSTGVSTVASGNSSATDYTVTVPPLTGTLVLTGASSFTDNTLCRYDSTGGLIQTTGIVVTDTNTVYNAGTEFNSQSDSYTMVIGDAGKTILMTKATAQTLTIPANSSVAFAVGTVINVVQTGAGQVTVAITTDTLTSSGSKVKLTGQYSAATLIKTASTTWVLVGDITA